MRAWDLLAPDPFGEALAAIGLIRVDGNGRQYAPDLDRLERVLQGIQAYRAGFRVLSPYVYPEFHIRWPLVAICGKCGAHYRIDLPGGPERAMNHQSQLKHQPWRTVQCRPWQVPPDTTIEQAGERSTVRPPARDPGQLIVVPQRG